MLIVTGAERYATALGYAQTLQFGGDHRDQTLRCGASATAPTRPSVRVAVTDVLTRTAPASDTAGKRLTQFVAMDACMLRSFSAQMQRNTLKAELGKAYCAFMPPSDGAVSGPLPAVATGNWGCGAFGGDKRIKFVIQLLAASVAGRDLAYFVLRDDALRCELETFFMALRELGATVGTAPLAAAPHAHRRLSVVRGTGPL